MGGHAQLPYVAHPLGQPGSKLAQWSLHKNVAHYVRELETARQWGKPFTVTEYAQPFWNRWRHESAALVPAVAAHQGWDAICQFAEMPIQLDYNASPFVRMQSIYPFGVGADPIAARCGTPCRHAVPARRCSWLAQSDSPAHGSREGAGQEVAVGNKCPRLFPSWASSHP